MTLTKDAKSILYTLYKEYEKRRKRGTPRAQAKNFGSAQLIQKDFFPDILLEDIEDFLRELSRNDFLDNLYADGTVYNCALSDNAIAIIESQAKENLLSIADFISKFIP